MLRQVLISSGEMKPKRERRRLLPIKNHPPAGPSIGVHLTTSTECPEAICDEEVSIDGGKHATMENWQRQMSETRRQRWLRELP